MSNTDKRVDAYIDKAADFAQPILKHLRALVHQTCPEVEETIKWSHPAFMYRGMLGGMAAFKAHCGFGLWKGRLIFGTKEKEEEAMGSFGRITCLKDLPPDKILAGYIRQGMALNEAGINSRPNVKPKPKKELVLPDFFAAALRQNKKAAATFDKFSYSHRKEYIEWLAEAKRDETRQKRLATALQWLTEGKSRNWKYANC
jgi:uncharacterized protein YdeI (YjbR/CyaY-like superfamily)